MNRRRILTSTILVLVLVGVGRRPRPLPLQRPHSRSTLHVLVKTLGFAKTAEQGTRGAWSLSTRTLQLATGVREPRPLPAASARREGRGRRSEHCPRP